MAALVAAALLSGGGRETLAGCRAALADGARQALPVGLACALVGVVIATMTLTGLGTIIGTALIGIGRDSIFLALVLLLYQIGEFEVARAVKGATLDLLRQGIRTGDLGGKESTTSFTAAVSEEVRRRLNRG